MIKVQLHFRGEQTEQRNFPAVPAIGSYTYGPDSSGGRGKSGPAGWLSLDHSVCRGGAAREAAGGLITMARFSKDDAESTE